MKIRIKLLFWFLIIVLISTISLGFTGYLIARKAFVENIFSELETLAESKEGQLFVYLDSIEARAIDFSSDGFIRDTLKEITDTGSAQSAEALNNHLIRNKMPLDETIVGILVIDLNGRVAASTIDGEIGNDESSDVYFMEGKKGIYTTEIKGHGHFNLTNTLVVSAPLTDKETGELLGVIVNVLNPGKLERILTGIFQIEKGSMTSGKGLKETLEVYVVNKEKVMFAHPLMGENHDGHKHFPEMKIDTLPVQKCLSNQEETTQAYTTYDGTEVFGASMCILDKKWTLIAEINQEEVLSALRKITNSFIIITIMIMLISLIISLFVAKTISNPIKKLHKEMEVIAKGNLNYKTNIRTKDEIGQLSKAFDTMTAALKKSRSNLEKQIADRTKELQSKVEQLENSQKFSVGRELKMIDLKKKIEEIKGIKERKNRKFSGVYKDKLYEQSKKQTNTGFKKSQRKGGKK